MKKNSKSKGGPKASLTKLSNKRLNKLAKQGKLKKKGAEKQKVLKLIHQRLHPHQRLQDHLHPKSGGPEKTFLGNEKPAEDIPLEEADYEYYAKDGRDYSFLSEVSLVESPQNEGTGNRRKRKKQNGDISDDDVAARYEKLPRKLAGADREVKAMLPIKTKERGVIPQTVQVETDNTAEATNDVKDEDASTTELAENVPPPPPISTAKLFIQRQQKLIERKQAIAQLSHAIIQEPESNLKKLRELRLMLEEDDPEIFLTVKKLAMVSLMEVFKDIVPEYRIRAMSEKEKSQSMKKDTKRLRDFEESLLTNYRQYLEFLECMAQGKPAKSKDQAKKKTKDSGRIEVPKEASKAMMLVSARCLCELLVAHPHFNYRTNIISVITPLVCHRDSQLSDLVIGHVKKIFREDRSGDVTLEIVRLLGRLLKSRHFDVHPRVLDTFRSLRIKEVNKGDKAVDNKAARCEKYRKMSRKDRKRHKQMGQLEKELQDAAVEENTDRKLKVHTEIINMVFLTYFRVLKHARHSVLLSSVLEGLAKFAHLINIDFFDDLFAVLNDLVDSGELTYRESFHCVQTAFTILSGQGAALNIDPLRFYKHLYRTLFQLHIGVSSSDVPIALECLDIMINKRRKQVSQQRMLAFMKRLVTLGLQLDTHGTLGCLATTRAFMHAYPRSDLLLDTESQGSGVYLPELEEPEHCNAHNTALYELHTLRHHYHPVVRRYTDHLLCGGPSQGVGALPAAIARKTPVELHRDFDTSEMTFNPPIDKKPKAAKKTVRFSWEYLQKELSALTAEILADVENTNLSSLNFCKVSSKYSMNNCQKMDKQDKRVRVTSKVVKRDKPENVTVQNKKRKSGSLTGKHTAHAKS